jgi:hypothetical protein
MLQQMMQHIRKFQPEPARKSEAQSGQSLIILVFAFLGLIAMLGLALDLGLVYIERVRVKRAVDAATLSGVVELPYEQQAFDRAIEYLDLNGYDSSDPRTYIFVSGCIKDVQDRFDDDCNLKNHADSDRTQVCRSDITHPYLYNKPVTDPYTRPYRIDTATGALIPTLPPTATWFLLDTTNYKGELTPDCDASQLVFGTANKLEITGTIPVNMNFMQFFGFERAPVTDNSVAENVSSLDVAVLFDVSGSMGYDPVCRGCWYKSNTNLNDIPPLGGTYPYYYTYPKNGTYRTILSSTITSDLCVPGSGAQSILYGSSTKYRYQVIEAELYSRNTSDVQTEHREMGKGYWVLQRNGSSAVAFNNISSEPGTYIQHMPERTFYPETNLYGAFYTAGDAANNLSPRVEYQFSFKHETAPDWRSTAGIWVRVRQGPYGQDLNGNSNKNTLYWALDKGSSPVVSPPETDTSAGSGWTMVHLTDIPVEFGPVYTLKLYAGSSGYAIDRIFITDNSSVPSAIYNGDASPGSAHGEACDPCNPIYGLTVTPAQCAVGGNFTVYTTTNWLDPQFGPIWQDANQPIRTSKEALKNFVQRLDPLFDQVSLVTFTSNNDSDTKIASELTCFQAERRQGISCYDGAHPISYTYVLRAIEQAEPQSMTCTSCGMRFGLQTLGFNTDNSSTFDNSCTTASSHCGRGGGANKVMILITDGTPNHTPIGINCDPLTAGGVTYDNHYAGGDPAYSSSYDCVLNYAEMAGNKGITLYTIGLGFAVDGEFLTQAAELGHGRYYPAGSPSQLDLIFSEILANIYVRLIR